MANSSNVDPVELAKFAATANEWWNVEGSFKTLHKINPLRLSFIQNQIDLTAKKIIDIGCGGGILAESLAKANATVTAIDLNDSAIQVAKTHAEQQQLNIEYQLISAEEIAHQCPAYYDIVTCMELLEHVPDPASIIQACAQLVKPGGYVFFSTINRNLKSFLLAIIGAEYALKLLPKGTHRYDQLIKPSELDQWSRQAGLTIQKIIGIHYNPFSQQFSLQPGVDVNYLVSYQKSP